MGRGSRAIVLDSMASGRVAHGERWSFTEIDSRMDVSICGKPVFINRTKIDPSRYAPTLPGTMGEFDYMACMGLFADGFNHWPRVATTMNTGLETEPQIKGGVSLLSRGGCVVRYLAHNASEMTRMNKKLWDAARELVIGLPPFDHRKY
jgi:urease accessory protein